MALIERVCQTQAGGPKSAAAKFIENCEIFGIRIDGNQLCLEIQIDWNLRLNRKLGSVNEILILKQEIEVCLTGIE